ncbi:MAG TPA: hypothetical protein VFR11_11680 [Micromonosporaceae bacterium]|nr:hypothetical protein [Micromonosporaceae bacterium]
MRLRSLAAFSAGYFLGTRAGWERYGQIIGAARQTSERLRDYRLRHDARGRAGSDSLLNDFDVRLHDGHS